MKKTGKILALGLTAAMAMGLAACGSQTKTADNTKSAGTGTAAPASTEAAAPASGTETAGNGAMTLKDGKLMVGVEIGYPPMEYYDEDGKTMIGFDIELAKAIGEKMGVEVEFVDTAWDGIFAGLNSDKYDCIISSVSITDERKQNFNFSEPYVANRQVLVVPVDSTIHDMNGLSGHSVAVQAETTADDYMKANADKLGAELFEYDKILNCFDDLKSGRSDSVFVDSVVAAYYLGEDASAYHTVWENTDVEPLGICIKKGNDTLTDALNSAIDKLYDDGTMTKIATKYFGSDISADARTSK